MISTSKPASMNKKRFDYINMNTLWNCESFNTILQHLNKSNLKEYQNFLFPSKLCYDQKK